MAGQRERHCPPTSRKLDWDVCELKARCCPSAVAYKIPRDLHEDAHDVARAHAVMSEYAEALPKGGRSRRTSLGMVLDKGK
jgi:hypothetical protein